MKEIKITATDEKAAAILALIIGEVDEIQVKRVGSDPVPVVVKRMYRGDKKAVDIVMEMFDENNHTRTTAAIQAHLVSLGFAEGTYTSTISKLVAEGQLTRPNRETVRLNPDYQAPQE